ncbi:hypothetical protein, partial [Nocardioides marmoraquaticus]
MTDNDGATASTTRTVTVSAPAVDVVALDGFDRSLASGWGSAETGGVWTLLGGTSRFSVSGSAGRISVASDQSRQA